MLKYGYVPESSHKGTDFKTTEKKERYLVLEKKKKKRQSDSLPIGSLKIRARDLKGFQPGPASRITGWLMMPRKVE